MHILQIILIAVLQKICLFRIHFTYYPLYKFVFTHISVLSFPSHVTFLLLLFVLIHLFYRQSDVEYTEHLHALERIIRNLEEYKIQNMDYLNQLLRQEC